MSCLSFIINSRIFVHGSHQPYQHHHHHHRFHHNHNNETVERDSDVCLRLIIVTILNIIINIVIIIITSSSSYHQAVAGSGKNSPAAGLKHQCRISVFMKKPTNYSVFVWPIFSFIFFLNLFKFCKKKRNICIFGAIFLFIKCS